MDCPRPYHTQISSKTNLAKIFNSLFQKFYPSLTFTSSSSMMTGRVFHTTTLGEFILMDKLFVTLSNICCKCSFIVSREYCFILILSSRVINPQMTLNSVLITTNKYIQMETQTKIYQNSQTYMYQGKHEKQHKKNSQSLGRTSRWIIVLPEVFLSFIDYDINL